MEKYQRMTPKKILSLALLLISFNSAGAQFQAQTGMSHAFDNNPFRLVEPEAGWISTFDLGLQYDLSALSFSYEGSFTRFDQLMERNFYWHRFSMFGGGEKIKWNVFLEQSRNSTDYNFYDHTAMVGSIDYQFNSRLLKIFWSGNFTFNYYPQIKEISNYFFHTNVRLNKSFSTRTSLFVGTGFSYKYYPNSILVETPQLSLQPSLTAWGGGYRGGFGGGDDGSYQIYSSEESSYTSQLQLWARVAQSLISTTGIALQYQKWIALSGYNRYVSGIMYDFNDESSIFDDPLGYELQSIHAELTQLLPHQFILKVGYDINDKEYTTQGIYTDQVTYSDSDLRVDQNKYLSISLQKNFSVGEMILDLELLYQWLKNNSNSYWYNYKSNYMALLLNWYF